MSACLTCRTVVARVASTGEPWTCGDCGSQHHPPSVTAPSVEDLEVSRLRALLMQAEAARDLALSQGNAVRKELERQLRAAKGGEFMSVLGEIRDGLELREKLASLAHEQWSGWMRHLFSKCFEMPDERSRIAPNLMVIPRWATDRWRRQLGTPYEALTEEEKESDRKEADRVLAVLRGASHG